MDKMPNTNDRMALGSMPIGKLLVQYSVPAVIACVATSLYNIIDSIFIGHGVGSLAIAGLGITLPLMNLVIAFCTLVAVGGATISSIFLGQKNLTRATDVINNVMTLCIIHSIVIGGGTLLFLDEILVLFGATPQTLPYAHDFMEVILLGTPISYIFIGLNNLMRATGYPAKAMISALLSVAVNVVLAPIFIFVFEWGIRGAALATICSQGIAFVWVLSHFLNKNSQVHLRYHNKWLSRPIVWRIYSIGLSPFLMNVCACVVVIFINTALLNNGGINPDMAVGAYSIMNRTVMVFVMIVFGISQGMQPILGFNFGANNRERVKQTLHKGIWIGVCVTTIGFLCTELFPDAITGMYTTDKQLTEIARDGFRIYFIFFPVVGAQIIIQNFFQSIGKPAISIFLSLTRQLLFLVPILIFLPKLLGINGVWWSLASSDLFSFIVAVITMWVMMRRHFRTHQQ